MRKTYIGLFAAVIVFMGPSSFAQQQINNDGASGTELQPQTQNIQNNAGSDRYRSEDIVNDVGNSDVLKNAQIQQLQVVGAPASTSTQESDAGIATWLVLAAGLLLVLLAPALLYVRDIRRKVATDSVVAEETIDELQAEPVVLVAEEQPVTSQSEQPTKKSKKKAKKSPHSKSKRSKKKKK